MLTHSDVEDFLTTTCPPTEGLGVRLVARWASEDLRLGSLRATLFLPDMHLLTEDDAEAYPRSHFRLNAELRRVMKALAGFKTAHPGELDVIHVGDLIDIWRALTGRKPKARVDAVTAEYSDVMEALFFGPPAGVRARLLAGNHDYDLHLLDEWNADRHLFLLDSPAGETDVLVVHGDQFDFIERVVPTAVKEAIVRLLRRVSAGRHELDAEDLQDVLALNEELPAGERIFQPLSHALDAAPAETPPGKGDNVVVWKEGGGNGPNTAYFDAARSLALKLKERGRDIRLVVCGHSHWARIVVGDRGDGETLVLADCGAWIGDCHFRDEGEAVRPSAQLGVLIGNDMRVYQLVGS